MAQPHPEVEVGCSSTAAPVKDAFSYSSRGQKSGGVPPRMHIDGEKRGQEARVDERVEESRQSVLSHEKRQESDKS